MAEGGVFKTFLDWVNADTGLPPVEEREQEHDGHGGHDDHGGHGEHGEHDGAEDLEGLDDFGGLEGFDMESMSEDEEDEELDNTKMLVDTLQSMSGSGAPPKPSSQSSRPPSPLLKEGLPRSRSAHILFRILSMTLTASIIAGLIITVSQMPPFGSTGNPGINEVYERYIEKGVEETGAINIVSGIVLDYRAFDTLGETIVLFAAITAIIILMRDSSVSQHIKDAVSENEETPQPLVFKFVVLMLEPFIILYGLYILLNGHLAPGGGFSGGAILGAGMSLYSFAFGAEKIRKVFSFKTFTFCVSFALIFYTLMKVFSLVAHVLLIDIPLGTPGNLFSAGLTLPLNIAVGIIVACTVYGLYALFSESEV